MFSDGTEKYFSLSSIEFKEKFDNFFRDNPFLYMYSRDRDDALYDMSGSDMRFIFKTIIGFRIMSQEEHNKIEEKKRMKKNKERREGMRLNKEFQQDRLERNIQNKLKRNILEREAPHYLTAAEDETEEQSDEAEKKYKTRGGDFFNYVLKDEYRSHFCLVDTLRKLQIFTEHDFKLINDKKKTL
jgi:hypothetical protein